MLEALGVVAILQVELDGCVAPELPLQPGEAQRVSFTLTTRDFSQIDEAGKRLYQPGRYRIFVGGSQPDERSGDLIGEDPLSLEVELTGSRDELTY